MELEAPKTAVEVQVCIDTLTDAWSEAQGVDFQTQGTIARDTLRHLARLGREAFDAIIPAANQAAFLRRLREATSPFSQIHSLSRGPVVCTDKATRVPWHLMFTGRTSGDTLEPRDFLGARFLFTYAPVTGRAAAPSQTRPPFRGGWPPGRRPLLGHLWDANYMPSGAGAPWLAGLGALDRREPAVLTGLPANKVREAGALKEFVVSRYPLFQFDSHGRKGPANTGGEIGVRRGYRTSAGELQDWKFIGNPHALACLNVCHAAQGPIDDPDGGVAEFMVKHLVAGLVAPSTKTPFAIAMEVSNALYERLLAGRSVASAFDEAQMRVFNARTGAASRSVPDPRALSYCLYGGWAFLMEPMERSPERSRHERVSP